MGKFSEETKVKEEIKAKDRVRREKLAGFFYDCAKLILAGVVIGGITPLYAIDGAEGINAYVTLAGASATILLAWIANRILK